MIWGEWKGDCGMRWLGENSPAHQPPLQNPISAPLYHWNVDSGTCHAKVAPEETSCQRDIIVGDTSSRSLERPP